MHITPRLEVDIGAADLEALMQASLRNHIQPLILFQAWEAMTQQIRDWEFRCPGHTARQRRTAYVSLTDFPHSVAWRIVEDMPPTMGAPPQRALSSGRIEFASDGASFTLDTDAKPSVFRPHSEGDHVL